MQSVSVKGAMVFIVSPQGEVVGVGVDYSQDRAPGYTLIDTQMWRARAKAKETAIRTLLPPKILTKTLRLVFVESMWDHLKSIGYSMQEQREHEASITIPSEQHCLPIGHQA